MSGLIGGAFGLLILIVLFEIAITLGIAVVLGLGIAAWLTHHQKGKSK